MNVRIKIFSNRRPIHHGILGCLLLIGLGMNRSAIALQVQNETKIALSGFSLSEAFGIEDHQAFAIDETSLLKLMYRLQQTSLANLVKYSEFTRDVDWEKLLADPPGYRLQVFKTVGRAKSIKRVRLPNGDEELKYVYRIRCDSDEGHAYELLSLTVPQSWLKAKHLDQPITSLGFFFTMIQTTTGGVDAQQADAAANQESHSDESAGTVNPNRNSIPLFLAKQVSWKPVQPNSELGIEPDHVLLAQHGVDIGALDFVRQEDRRPLGTKDAKTFYEFLNAVAEIDEPEGLNPINHMELLRNPGQSHGRFVQFRARVKKCSVVRPPVDSSSADRPIDQYYQLIVFPDLRDSRDDPTFVEIGRGETSLNYRRFPFTICCRQLPKGITPAGIEDQQVWIQGFYFRFWLYSAERTTSAGVAGQLSPLIIGNRAQMVESDFGSLAKFSNSLLLIFVGVLAIVGFSIVRLFRRNRTLQESLPEKLDIEGLSEL